MFLGVTGGRVVVHSELFKLFYISLGLGRVRSTLCILVTCILPPNMETQARGRGKLRGGLVWRNERAETYL